MNSNLRLSVLLTILISISAFSYFNFFRDTVSEQVGIENEIQTSTTISSTSTTLKPENTITYQPTLSIIFCASLESFAIINIGS